ncbi:MAG: hypothetical protein IT447_13800 [Phycisphaerales bacterium]|jgi:hypothetical protein|nr:hypothetical protein [Phycisphaerales bacterium]
MKRICISIILLIVGAMAGCASQPTAQSASPVSNDQTATATLNIPANAQWTLFCQRVTGADHVIRANQIKSILLKSTKLPDWYVLHGEQDSTLYYGFYRTIDDPQDSAETTRAQRDRQAIAALKDQVGEHPFAQAVFVPLQTPDPAGPPEWNLANTPPSAIWTLQIAAYKDSPDRKQAAVDSVREARKEGIPAYYYHGASVSSVCIGTWPAEAVRRTMPTPPDANPNDPVLVLDHAMPGLPTEIEDKEGNTVRTLAPKIEVLDPTLLEVMKKYPYHYLNGAQMMRKIQDPATGTQREVYDPSFIVQIPHTGHTPLIPPSQAATNPPAQQTPSQPAPPTPPVQPTPGKLRSIGR